MQMNSVSHLLQYHQLTPELPVISEAEPPVPQGWPRYGIITCEAVSVAPLMSGTVKGSNLLRNIWCCIRAQEKVRMFKVVMYLSYFIFFTPGADASVICQTGRLFLAKSLHHALNCLLKTSHFWPFYSSVLYGRLMLLV